MKRIILPIITISCFLVSGSLSGSVVKLEAESGFSRSFSFTEYKIGGDFELPDGTEATTVFPLSRLKFPLNLPNWYAGVTGTVLDTVILHVKVSGNMRTDAGTMKDYDWNSAEEIEIYSESDAVCHTFLTVDADVSYRLFSLTFFSLSAGVGFAYQFMDFTCEDLTQWDSSGGPTVVTQVSGPVLEYEVGYYIPYVAIYPGFSFWRLDITIKLALSPYTVGKDRDDHLLRSKLSTGEASGVSASAALNVRCRIISNFFVSIEFGVHGIFLEGTQSQERYAATIEGPPGPIVDIDNRIESTQMSLSFGAGYSLEI